MAGIHPIVDKLRDRRRQRHLSQKQVALDARVSETFVQHHEKDKFPSLVNLDRWCLALGYRLVLVDDVKLEEVTDFRADDWRRIA